MAPNGGSSMTSQARAAELNAAAAARARILNGYCDGELPDIRPKSTPSQFTTSQTQIINTEHVTVESFKRPNRPVDRYRPPVVITPTPVTAYAYPQFQYADPRPIPAVYISTHYPAATEYYQPVYHPMQSYPQVYPGYISGYHPPVSPQHRGDIAAMTRQSTSHSPAASPIKPGRSQHAQIPATPPVEPSRFSSPAKSVSRGPSKSPPKSPVKILRATPSPKKPPVEVLRYFTPDDLSPPKIEIELIRFKAAQEKITKDEEKSKASAEDKARTKKSQAESVNEDESDNGHHGSKDPEVDEDQELTPRAKQPELSNVLRVSCTKFQSAMEAPPEPRQPLALEASPLTQEKHRKAKIEMVRPFSFLPPGFVFQSGMRNNLSPADQQVSRVEETHGTKLARSINQNDELFYIAQKTVDSASEATPKAVPRRLQSPFQLRLRSPVAYYKPIVNKYPRNVFASWQSRLEELWAVETSNSWLTFQQQPRVKETSGPSKRYPHFLIINEVAQCPTNTGVPMPPPGFTVPGPVLLPHSAHWNLESNPSNRAQTYYERVLEAEDWFHQSILKHRDSSNKFQKKLTEVQSIILNDSDPFQYLPPSKDIIRAQVTCMIKRISENVISYTNTEENEERGFDFSNIEFLDAETGLRRSKRFHRKNRISLRERNCGAEFDIAPGCELFDGGVVGSNFVETSTSRLAASDDFADSDSSELTDRRES